MKLIRKTRKEKNKNGRWIYYGIFLCSFNNKEVEKRLDKGRKQKSCGCQTGKEISESIKGIKKSEEHKEKIGLANKGKKRTEGQNKRRSEAMKGKNHPLYGKHRTEEVKKKIKEGLGDMSGKNNPMYGKKHTEETRQKMRNKAIGREVLEETRQKMSKYRKGKWIGKDNPMYGKKRELSPNWNGGSSFEIYPKEFNKEFKQFIKNRDLNICQTPGCMNTENLCIHHIDYDKKNNNPENLITLCGNCHCKTNVHNREYWTNYYSEIVSVYL